MDVEQVIAAIWSGALNVWFHVDQEMEQGRLIFRSTVGAALDAEMAVFLARPADDESRELLRMILLSDTRLCPCPDEHRSSYSYDMERVCFCCPVCAKSRRGPGPQDDAAAVYRHWQ